ncbi:MAG: LicD family protein [Fusobacteriaceae bacterium]
MEQKEELPLREIQMVCLDILKFVDKICEKEDIKYWITAGTLLGAIRHEGFIPWDDDIDIGMPRNDFEKFKSAAKKYLPEYYVLEEGEIILLKIFDLRYETEGVNPKDKYIFIDVSPYDMYSKNEYMKFFQRIPKYINNFKIKSNTSISDGKAKKDKIVITICKVFKFFPYSVINFLLKKWKIFLNRPNKDSVYSHSNEVCFEGEFLMEYLFPLKKIKFENQNIWGPKNSDDYLVKKYGNYMEIPPESERHIHIKKAIKKSI